MQKMLELYHHSESVCAQKVRLALAEKNLEWTSHYVTLEKGEHRTKEFRKINPKEVVPVLIHDGLNIPESTVICEYIDEAFDGPPLMPAEAYWRSRKRLWTKRVDEGLHYPHTYLLSFITAFRHMSMAHLDTPEKINEYLDTIGNPRTRQLQEIVLTQGMDSDVFREAIVFYDTVLADMETALSENDWLAGSSFSLADIGLAPYVHRVADLDMMYMCESRPAVRDWYERIKSRESWQKAIIDWNDPNFLEPMQHFGRKARPVTEKTWREHCRHE